VADDASDLRGTPAETAHCGLEEVVSYRAGELPPERAADLADHLAGCAGCRRLVRDAATVLTQIGVTVRAAESKVNQVDLILARLRRKAAARAARPTGWEPRQPSQRFWLPVFGVAAVVVLVALLQLLMVMLPRFWRAAHGTAEPLPQPSQGAAVGPLGP